MGVRCDFSDIEAALAEAPSMVAETLAAMGEEAVGYAKANGSYTDRTGRLRRSTDFAADARTLIVENDTPYASHVEHRGYDVLTGAKFHIQDKYGLRE